MASRLMDFEITYENGIKQVKRLVRCRVGQGMFTMNSVFYEAIENESYRFDLGYGEWKFTINEKRPTVVKYIPPDSISANRTARDNVAKLAAKMFGWKLWYCFYDTKRNENRYYKTTSWRNDYNNLVYIGLSAKPW